MEQLTFWRWVCKCGGILEEYPVYRKDWGKVKNLKMCYKCMTMCDENFNPLEVKVKRVVKQI